MDSSAPSREELLKAVKKLLESSRAMDQNPELKNNFLSKYAQLSSEKLLELQGMLQKEEGDWMNILKEHPVEKLLTEAKTEAFGAEKEMSRALLKVEEDDERSDDVEKADQLLQNF